MTLRPRRDHELPVRALLRFLVIRPRTIARSLRVGLGRLGSLGRGELLDVFGGWIHTPSLPDIKLVIRHDFVPILGGRIQGRGGADSVSVPAPGQGLQLEDPPFLQA